MFRFFRFLIHLLAFISLYIILVVGLGCFWTIGSSEKYESINNVLINLSYSFITGYLVYLFTVYIPGNRRSKKISLIVSEKLKSIAEHSLAPCLRAFAPALQFNNAYSDQELVTMYEQGDLLSSTFYSTLNSQNNVLELHHAFKDRIIKEIDGIIDKYGHDLSEDLLKWLEALKKDHWFDLCVGYSALITLRKANNIQNGNTTPDENRVLAESLISLRDKILKQIVCLQSNHQSFIFMKPFSFFKNDVIISDNEIDNAFNQQSQDKWTFFNERLHMESVFSKRVNLT